MNVVRKLLDSVKPAMKRYFIDWDAAPDDPVHVEMPKKTVVTKDENGKDKKSKVDDRDLE